MEGVCETESSVCRFFPDNIGGCDRPRFPSPSRHVPVILLTTQLTRRPGGPAFGGAVPLDRVRLAVRLTLNDSIMALKPAKYNVALQLLSTPTTTSQRTLVLHSFQCPRLFPRLTTSTTQVQVVSYYRITMSLPFSLTTLVGGYHYPLQSAQNQASAPGVSHFIDGSGPIFSMYLERAEEEDKKMAENWKADADGILIFVRLCSSPMLHTDSSVIDWFILRCCCILDLSVDSGHPTEPTGHLQLLPCQYLSHYR